MWFEDDHGELIPGLPQEREGAEAFILGAGFSHAISEAMPVVADLIEPLDQFLASQPGFSSATVPRPDNVELFLSALAMPQPYLTPSENHRNQALFLEVAQWLARFVFERQREALSQAVPSWLESLLRTWHSRRSAVVSFNYDTLIESAVMSLTYLNQSTRERIMPHFTYATPVRFAAGELGGISDPYHPTKPTFTLCKLHGSLSWWRSGSSRGEPTDREVWKDTFKEGGGQADWSDVAQRGVLGEPMLVPPTFAKSDYFDTDVLRVNWRRARFGIEKAATIVVMGYSVPEADVQMAALLGASTRSQQILVVDLDPNAIVGRIAKAALPRGGVVRPFESKTDAPIREWATEWTSDPDGLYAQPSF